MTKLIKPFLLGFLLTTAALVALGGCSLMLPVAEVAAEAAFSGTQVTVTVVHPGSVPTPAPAPVPAPAPAAIPVPAGAEP